MNFFFPLKEALSSPIGDVLLFLIISFCIVSFFYFYFWLKFSRQKDLTKCHHSQFKKTESQLKELTFKGFAKSDFFGKKQVVTLTDGRFGQSLIFYPELYSDQIVQRFGEYHLLLDRSGSQHFPKNMIKVQNQQLVNVELQYMLPTGQTLMNLSHYLLDKTLTTAEKELFLIDVAYSLEALHQLKTTSNETLYHGFLLPSSFYLSINMVKRITNVYLSDHGCSFSLGALGFQSLYSKCMQRKYLLDPFIKKQLDSYQFILSPEQKLAGRPVTSATDYYSFAALAIFLFTQKPFETTSSINWQLVPIGWRVFLKECLHQNPQDRPRNFLEIKEYFSAPEHEIASLGIEEEKIDFLEKETSKETLKNYFKDALLIKNEAPFLGGHWQEGFKAIKEGRWEDAQNIFEAMEKDESKRFDGHLGLAILYYQKGETDLSKEHYIKAQKIDAKKIRCFQKLISFDI